ncbi:MAG: translation initiation factor IF-2 subunit beta [Candidatus Methanosuratus sp.]|nr:translation initiation factor IF-2 subunit beta [Candidatus Methanosuratincola sp.]
MSYDYEALLQRGFSKMPEKVFKSSKYETPKAEVAAIGSKTLINNFKEIASRLNRTPNHLLKFMVRELATSGIVEDSRASLNGKFSKEVIDELIIKYIKDYVLCNSCNKPDTKLAKEGRLTFIVCEVCGAKNPAKTLT